MQLTATAVDSKGNTVPNQSFIWTRSNTTLATVSSTGVVTGKKSGNVTIKDQMTVVPANTRVDLIGDRCAQLGGQVCALLFGHGAHRGVDVAVGEGCGIHVSSPRGVRRSHLRSHGSRS